MWQSVVWVTIFACTGGKNPLETDGDTDGTTETDVETDVETDPTTFDFSLPGTFATMAEDGTATLASCDMDYERFQPVQGGLHPDTVVMLSHGFQRSPAQMADLAVHLASWGVEVVTPALCHASIFDTDHAQNAADIQALAATLGYTRVLYVGHSAGGLASWLAAAADPASVAMLGLDPVDSGDLGAAGLGPAVPAYGLFGEPSSCNADNNGLGWFDSGIDRRALGITDADHCDFESPTDSLCPLLCPGGSDVTFTDPQIHEVVTALTTEFVLWKGGYEDESVWDVDGWVSEGRVVER